MVIITALVAAGFVLVYRILCAWENRRRDKTGTVEGFEHAYEDDLTDKNVRPLNFTGVPILTANRICNSGMLCEHSDHGVHFKGIEVACYTGELNIQSTWMRSRKSFDFAIISFSTL